MLRSEWNPLATHEH